MSGQTPKPQRKQRTGYDMSARQQRIRRQEAERAEARQDERRRDEALGSCLKNLSERYSEAAAQEQAETETKSKKGSKRPQPVAFAGSGLQRQSGIRTEGLSYRSNEEALPSRHGGGRRNRSPRSKSAANRVRQTQPKEFDATALSFGPSLGTAAPKLPVIWGAGMPKPKPPPKAEPVEPTSGVRGSEVTPEVQEEKRGYAAAAASPPKPDTPPPAPAPTPATPEAAENDVWGADTDEEDDGDIVPLQPGQAWGDMA